ARSQVTRMELLPELPTMYSTPPATDAIGTIAMDPSIPRAKLATLVFTTSQPLPLLTERHSTPLLLPKANTDPFGATAKEPKPSVVTAIQLFPLLSERQIVPSGPCRANSDPFGATWNEVISVAEVVKYGA